MAESEKLARVEVGTSGYTWAVMVGDRRVGLEGDPELARRSADAINTASDARMEAFRKRIIKVIEAKKPTVCFDTNDAGYRQAVLDVLRGVKAVPL